MTLTRIVFAAVFFCVATALDTNIHRGGKVKHNDNVDTLSVGQAGGGQFYAGGTGVLVQSLSGLGQFHRTGIGILGEVIHIGLVHNIDGDAANGIQTGIIQCQIAISAVRFQIQGAGQHGQRQLGFFGAVFVGQSDIDHGCACRSITLNGDGLVSICHGNAGRSTVQHIQSDRAQLNAIVFNGHRIFAGCAFVVSYRPGDFFVAAVDGGEVALVGSQLDLNGVDLLVDMVGGSILGDYQSGSANDTAIQTFAAAGSFRSCISKQTNSVSVLLR